MHTLSPWTCIKQRSDNWEQRSCECPYTVHILCRYRGRKAVAWKKDAGYLTLAFGIVRGNIAPRFDLLSAPTSYSLTDAKIAASRSTLVAMLYQVGIGKMQRTMTGLGGLNNVLLVTPKVLDCAKLSGIPSPKTSLPEGSPVFQYLSLSCLSTK